jgi:hypothetical protein
MKPPTYITTSWDDGHPLDFRVAELLAKYGLRGTFYVPRTTEHGTMTDSQVRELSSTFEVGAHTLEHVPLTAISDERAWSEIADSRAWIESCTGQPCPMFCAPWGKFAPRHLDLVRRAGYTGLRSVELLSLDLPRSQAGLLLLPTTVQAHPPGLLTYPRNAIKRAAWRNLWRYLLLGCCRDWTALVRAMLARVLEQGGVFHLWGHSWELEQAGQWQRLEEILCYLSEFKTQAEPLTNSEVCQVHQPWPVGGLLS